MDESILYDRLISMLHNELTLIIYDWGNIYMDLQQIERIKKIAIIAMVSDDYLMDQLVLKGGNAIDLVYQISGRASIDLDFSMPSDFAKDYLDSIESNIKSLLIAAYKQEELIPFDISLIRKPEQIGEINGMQFWGGYRIEFKVIPQDIFKQYSDNIEALRRNSTVIGPSNRKIFRIEISKFEYCDEKIAKDIDGYTVYVYTTEMIVLEKIRAICQQHPDYRAMVKSHPASARARDFFDIYIITQMFPINLRSKRVIELLKTSFSSKRVPLDLIHKVASQREFHRTGYPSLRDTVKEGVDLKDFDFYFDYVVGMLGSVVI